MVVMIEDGGLTLEQIRREDSGKYECVATNIVTSVITATQLIIESKTPVVLFSVHRSDELISTNDPSAAQRLQLGTLCLLLSVTVTLSVYLNL